MGNVAVAEVPAGTEGLDELYKLDAHESEPQGMPAEDKPAGMPAEDKPAGMPAEDKPEGMPAELYDRRTRADAGRSHPHALLLSATLQRAIAR